MAQFVLPNYKMIKYELSDITIINNRDTFKLYHVYYPICKMFLNHEKEFIHSKLTRWISSPTY